MKMIWESSQPSQQAGTTRTQLVIWDFLKMLATAVLCGLAVSVVVAGITLLLTRSAEARMFQKGTATKPAAPAVSVDDVDNDDYSPTPGELLLGEGCESIFLKAMERDWQVRIDGKRVEVRVMQTFRLPAESAQAATFQVQLIKGARMVGIAAQSSTKDWAGQVISVDDYNRLTPAEYLNLSRNQILASHSSGGTVMTSPLLGLSSGDLITIEYTYVMTLDASEGFPALILPLEASEKYAASGLLVADNEDAIPPSRRPVRGSVWVAWTGNKPSRVMGLPDDADLEISKSRVEGFSWAARDLQPGATFQFAWTL
jgi:hypothetical protein